MSADQDCPFMLIWAGPYWCVLLEPKGHKLRASAIRRDDGYWVCRDGTNRYLPNLSRDVIGALCRGACLGMADHARLRAALALYPPPEPQTAEHMPEPGEAKVVA